MVLAAGVGQMPLLGGQQLWLLPLTVCKLLGTAFSVAPCPSEERLAPKMDLGMDYLYQSVLCALKRGTVKSRGFASTHTA